MVSETAASGLSHYVWWFPGSPVRVHLALEMVHRLREQLQQAGPKGAGEGLLFGKPVDGGTEVLDFQPAAGHVPELVATVVEGKAKRQLVGYYRIETGDRLRLCQNDLSLARSLFDKPYHVFLLIQPTEFGPPNASFFFHESDGKMAEFSIMEFPFEPSLLASEEHDRLRRSREAAARRAAALQPDVSVSSPAPARRRSVSLLRVVLGCAALVALSISGTAVWINRGALSAWWSRPPVQPAATARPDPSLSFLSMGLRARRENRDVEITWNRESPVIAAATSGVLTIQDGSSKREIPLDVAQVRSSSVLYTPTGNAVTLQLSIKTPVSIVIESVMLLGTGNVVSTPLAAAVSTPLREADATPSPARALKPFTPPAVTTARAAQAEIPAPPPVQPVPGDRTDTASLLPLMSQAPLPPPAPAAQALPSEAPNPLPYQAPTPVRKAVPRVPPQFLATMVRPATIEVRVSIDNTGRVTRAETVPQAGVSNLVLNELANAARSWIFKPARRGDVPVASESVLQFHYSK